MHFSHLSFCFLKKVLCLWEIEREEAKTGDEWGGLGRKLETVGPHLEAELVALGLWAVTHSCSEDVVPRPFCSGETEDKCERGALRNRVMLFLTYFADIWYHIRYRVTICVTFSLSVSAVCISFHEGVFQDILFEPSGKCGMSVEKLVVSSTWPFQILLNVLPLLELYMVRYVVDDNAFATHMF